LKNKYTNWYLSIVTQARRKVNTGYTELHHIIPRCLGGPRTKENEVRMTAREHFICHMLLRKMTTGDAKKKMSFAAFAVSRVRRNDQLKITSRSFELLRMELSQARKGIPRSIETRRKISESKTGQILSAKTRDAISRGIKQRYLDHPVSPETKIKIGNVHRGKTMSDKTKAKIGASSKGRTAGGQKQWILKDSVGTIHTVTCLSDFCKDRGLPWKSISRTEGTNVAVSRGIAKGWSVLYSSRV
jgi:hypothetical protein